MKVMTKNLFFFFKDLTKRKCKYTFDRQKKVIFEKTAKNEIKKKQHVICLNEDVSK